MGDAYDRDAPAASEAALAEMPEWNQELSERLYRLFYRRAEDGSDLTGRIESLLAQYGDAVFSELIFMLSHLRFRPAEAREHWHGILAHQERMAAGVGTSVDLRVALVSYFVDINRQFDNPKVIELRLFEQTQASAYRDELTGLFNHRHIRRQNLRQTAH